MKYNSVLFFLCLLLLTACHQDPSPTGIGLLPPGDLVNVHVFDSRTDSTHTTTGSFQQTVTSETSPYLSVGKAEGFEAHALVRWLSLPLDINGGGRFLSAKMKLFVAPYHIGDEQKPLSVEVREVASFWSSFTFSADSIQKLSTRTMPGGMIQPVLGDSLLIELDTNVVRTWFRKIAEGKVSEVYGVLLSPGTGEGHLHAFHSVESDKRPQLVIQMSLNGTDTTIHGALPEDTYVVSGSALSSSEFFMHGGLAKRGKLTLDVNSIPPGSIINHAKFEVTIDRANSKSRYRGIDSTVMYEISTGMTGDTSSFLVALSSKATNPDVLVFESFALTRLVQRWVNDPTRNLGVAISAINESSDLDLFMFYDGTAETTKRPRLTVTYTRQP